ncbi:hypothetical protein SLEP1_g26623 [Rubroshorea leprosula]|uniref:Uncharacterized protein n=1 Tax=Rubroshorea leprosula TaxID=152421 RepID=A0AAV5JTZ6_9ROSI|nr:hypothetical protein SLEP1_g26623 [Rubroshorea leprosula]
MRCGSSWTFKDELLNFHLRSTPNVCDVGFARRFQVLQWGQDGQGGKW